MSEAVGKHLESLRAAADSGRWDAFEQVFKTWAAEEPANAWVQAGLAAAGVLNGGEVDDTQRESLAHLDERLLNQVEALASLRAGRAQDARDRIVAEAAHGVRAAAWVDAYRCVTQGTEDGNRHLFAAPHLVAGCIVRDGQIQSMAAKGSRMSADSLGHRSDQIWGEIIKLSQRVDIGSVRSMQLVADDGGWVLVSDEAEVPRLATALVAAPVALDEAMARAQAAVVDPEASDD